MIWVDRIVWKMNDLSDITGARIGAMIVFGTAVGELYLLKYLLTT